MVCAVFIAIGSSCIVAGCCVGSMRTASANKTVELVEVRSRSSFSSRGGMNQSSLKQQPLVAAAGSPGRCPGLLTDFYRLEGDLGSGNKGDVKQIREISSGKVMAVKRVLELNFGLNELGPMVLGLPFNMPVQSVFLSEEERHRWCPDKCHMVEVVMPLFDGGSFAHLDFCGSVWKDSCEDKDQRPEGAPLITKTRAAMIALGLYHLHDAGFIHRDLKGDNIMLKGLGTKDELAAVVDYGFATEWTPKDNAKVDRAPDTIGNDMYRSPERWMQGGQHGPESDWFAFGLLLYHSHTGRRLYRSSKFWSDSEMTHAAKMRSWLGANLKNRLRTYIDPYYGDNEKLIDFISLLLHQSSNRSILWDADSTVTVQRRSGKTREKQIYKAEFEDYRIYTYTFANTHPSIARHPVLNHPYLANALAQKWPWNSDQAGLCTCQGCDGVTSSDTSALCTDCQMKGKGWSHCACRDGCEVDRCCCFDAKWDAMQQCWFSHVAGDARVGGMRCISDGEHFIVYQPRNPGEDAYLASVCADSQSENLPCMVATCDEAAEYQNYTCEQLQCDGGLTLRELCPMACGACKHYKGECKKRFATTRITLQKGVQWAGNQQCVNMYHTTINMVPSAAFAVLSNGHARVATKLLAHMVDSEMVDSDMMVNFNKNCQPSNILDLPDCD